MSLTGYPIRTFGGLNLVSDPEQVGAEQAVDLLNVDLDKYGRVHSRNGYDNFTAAAHGSRFKFLSPFYTTTGTKQLMACTAASGASASIVAYNTAGAVVNSFGAGIAATFGNGVRFGTPTVEYMYLPSRDILAGLIQVVRWDGTNFTQPATIPATSFFTVQSPDNRMVAANYLVVATFNPSRVGFSTAGNAEVWGATDFVDITPGDGESITGLVSWRELVFAFKETKFAVFTGNSVGPTGLPVFNYRLVNAGIGTPKPIAVGRPGVFFMNRRGIYMTTGTEPRLISSALDPLFLGGVVTPYTASAINMAQITNAAMYWYNERLFVAVATGASTTNDTLLVWDSKIDQWMVWDIPAAGLSSFRVSDTEDLVFAYAAGSNHIGRQNLSFTDDDGTAIATYYQSGFYQPSPNNEITTRWTELWGMGSPTFNIFTNHAASDPLTRGGTVTLGTSPQVAKGTHLKSYTGQLLSHKLSSTSGAWSVSRIEHQITNVFTPQ